MKLKQHQDIINEEKLFFTNLAVIIKFRIVTMFIVYYGVTHILFNNLNLIVCSIILNSITLVFVVK